MTLEFNPQIQNAPLDTVRDAIDSGGAPGSLQILAGALILATLPLSLPSFADASGGTSTANPIAPSAAVESGTPDAFRFVTSYGATVFAGAIPDDLELVGAATVVAGGEVSVSGYTLTEGTVQAREFASTIPYPYTSGPPPVTPLRLLMTGDSTTWGYGSNGSAKDDARVNSLPVRFSAFADANGVASDAQSIFGRGGNSDTEIVDADPRIQTLGFLTANTIASLGGGAFEGGGMANPLIVDIDEADGITLTGLTYSNGGIIRIVVDDGTTLHQIGDFELDDAAITLRSETFAIPAGLAAYQLQISVISVGYDYLFGIELNNSSKPLTVIPAGWNGQQSSNYATNNGVYDPQKTAAHIAPDALWVNQGLNDVNTATPQGTFEANYRVYLDAVVAANPSIKLFLQIPPDQQPGLSYLPASITALAVEYGAVLLDSRLAPNMATYMQANNAGLMFDGFHPNGAGYQNLADYFGPIVLAELYP